MEPDMDKIVVDYTNIMADSVGEEHGLTEAQFESGLAKYGNLPARIQKKREEGKIDFMNLPSRAQDLESILDVAQKLRSRFSNFVVVGIGGSSLGSRALHLALNHPFHNILEESKRGGSPRIFFAENVDPDSLAGLLEILDLEKTLFNVITKSGTTAETVANFLVFCSALKKSLGTKYREHIIATTDPQKGALRELARREGFITFPVPEGVGGRFSVLSAVGLLPAAFCGIDIGELLAGARDMDERIANSTPSENPALILALSHYLLHTLKGKLIAAFMPYSDALRGVAQWFCQLWAESLGKKLSLDGKVINTGQTPVSAVGATDQHSQIQLFAEGPNDKLIVFVQVKKFSSEVQISRLFRDIAAFSYLGDSSINRLLDAELRGTELSLTQAQRPNLRIVMPEISAHTVGQLFFMLEVQAACAGLMYNVNAFDQPGVEAGKIAAYALMGRRGYEQERRRIERTMREQHRRTV
jgi:glucose-6-phosphate isomerase